jgi:hypothetical protein
MEQRVLITKLGLVKQTIAAVVIVNGLMNTELSAPVTKKLPQEPIPVPAPILLTTDDDHTKKSHDDEA